MNKKTIFKTEKSKIYFFNILRCDYGFQKGFFVILSKSDF